MGHMLYIVLTTMFLFNTSRDGNYRKFSANPAAVFAKNKSNLSSEAQDLIAGMLMADPKQRYTLQQVKAHPWF